MEPPVGYALMHRSIVPESQFRTDTHRWFRAECPGLESCFRTFPATTREPIRIPLALSRGHSVRPKMVVGASYLECTRDGLLRHVVYLGEREDKSAVKGRAKFTSKRLAGKDMSKQAQKEADTDLARLWEEHIRHEFETRSTDDTLDTMVEDAYVDHVPVLTGGSGKAELREFYATHFIPRMPPDMEMVPISRTIGMDQLVDEMVVKFTHSVEMDWMLPGIPPTGLRVEVALVVIVRFRDGKLAHEHIYWDQASVLAQLGLLDPQKLPLAGVESAKKVLDPALPANALIQRASLLK
jgi:carboxymethylenebutenolidase